MNPKISVLMGIYNCGDTLSEAIESILRQTEQDFDLILCDDGSLDDTYAIAKAYRDQYPYKITLLKNEENMGLHATLNRCFSAAHGEYIARMDGDDISMPDRFQKELIALEGNPKIALVSTPMVHFDESGTWATGKALPLPQPMDLVRSTPFCHGPCMIRREALLAVGGYTDDPKFLRVEDYDLWVKLYAAGYRGMNLTEPLYKMRDDRNAASRRKFRYRINEFRVKAKAVRLLHLPLWTYILALRPILVGLLPMGIYQRLHKARLKG